MALPVTQTEPVNQRNHIHRAPLIAAGRVEEIMDRAEPITRKVPARGRQIAIGITIQIQVEDTATIVQVEERIWEKRADSRQCLTR